MNPRQRLLGTIRGRAHDRVPIVLEGFLFASRDEIDAIEDEAKREIAHRTFEQSHYWVHCHTQVNRYLVTPPRFIRRVSKVRRGGEVEITTQIDTPKGTLTAVTGRNPLTDTVWTKKYPCESPADIEKIRSVPWELPDGVGPPDPSNLPDDFDRRGVLRAGVSSPFVCVAGMMPYQYFLELCATHFELIRDLTAICRQRILDILQKGDGSLFSTEKTPVPFSVEYVWMGGCEWLTPPMGSPRLYERLVQEQERAIIERCHAAGAICHVHCHGNVRSTLELVIQRGGDIFEPVEPPPDGDITMAEAKAVAAGRITLAGNVEARVLENEDVEAAEAATRAAFEGGREQMVLRTTAGPIGPVTPRMLANYHRMIDVWEQLSPL